MGRTWLVVVVAGAMSLALPCVGEEFGGYDAYSDWEGWARVRRGEVAGLASSWDRTGANFDFSQYESPAGLILDDRPTTAATIEGPGIVWRFWMPHLTANRDFAVRMYFDGEATPRIDSDSIALLSGPFSYFGAPLVTTSAGGQVCYEPIPFRSSLRIETENKALPSHPAWHANRHYYQYTYTSLAPEADCASWSGTLTGEQQAARADVIEMFNNPGTHPAGEDPASHRMTTAARNIAPGTCLDLAELSGPGVVRRLCVRMDNASDADLSALAVRVWYDGSAQVAIDVPVGEFFGAGSNRARYRSLPLGTDSPDGFYSFWPMPFRKGIRIALCNTGDAGVSIDGATVDYMARPAAADLAYLHAQWNTSIVTATQAQHTILSTTGLGHYVGNRLALRQPGSSFAMLEADETILVDGQAWLRGTGMEDAYNGGYYYNWVGIQTDEPEGLKPQAVIRPLHGVLYVNQDTVAGTARADQYRWQIADRVPFRKSIAVNIEARPYAAVGTAFSSVAFWYALPPVPGDADGDADVDWQDVAAFVACGTRAAVPQNVASCRVFDFDGDSDLDMSDFGMLQRCFCGSDAFGDPGCAD